MNNRQRQLLVVFLASIGLGLLGGLAYNVTLNMLKPEKIEFDQASPDQQRKPQFNRSVRGSVRGSVQGDPLIAARAIPSMMVKPNAGITPRAELN